MSEALDWSGLTDVATVSTVDNEATQNGERPYYGPPGGRAPCPVCGKDCHITQAGTLRSHKCEPGSKSHHKATTPSAGTVKRRRKGAPPAKVRDIAIKVMAGVTEESAGLLVGRYVPMDPDRVPADIPDDDIPVMFGPLVDLIWPQLPKGAQRVLAQVAEESDLIACAFAWWDYGRKLQGFAVQQRERVNREQAEQASGPGGLRSVPRPPDSGGDIFAEPFTPAEPTGSEAL